MAEFSAKMREVSDMLNEFAANLESEDRPQLHELQSYVNDNIELSPATDFMTRIEIQKKMGELLSSAENELNHAERRCEQWIEIWIKITNVRAFLLDDSKWG